MDIVGDLTAAELKELQSLAAAVATALSSVAAGPSGATTTAAGAGPARALPAAAGREFGSDLAVVSPWTADRFARDDAGWHFKTRAYVQTDLVGDWSAHTLQPLG